MNVKRLHTAVRRYLLERQEIFLQEWRVQEAARQERRVADLPKIPGDGAIARHLLRAVERRTPADFRTVEELRAWLLALGGRHEDDVRHPVGTVGKGDHIRVEYQTRDAEELAEAAEERARFRVFLHGLRDADLECVVPLPNRRLLTERESARWRSRLAVRWDAHPRDEYWYPLRGPTPSNVLALQDLYFYLEVEPVAFRSAFLRRGVTRVFEFVENHVFGRDCELDVDLFVPRPAERFWTSRELDWLVYVSHEHSITFAGEWLLEEIQALWPNWRERRYTGWGYANALEQTVLRANPWFRAPWWDLP